MRLRVLTLPICALVLLSACSGGSSASSDTGSSSSTAGSSTTQESTASTASADTESATASELPTNTATDTATGSETALSTSTAGVPDNPSERVKPGVDVPKTPPTELVITNLIEGDGQEAQSDSEITFNYVLALQSDGSILDSSYDRGSPVSVQLGVGQLIPGVDQGLVGVKEGGRRQLDMPPELAYGPDGSGPIPPNSAITFVIDVISVQQPPPPPTIPERADNGDCPAADGSSPRTTEFAEYPPFCIDVDAQYTATISTTKGDVKVKLYADKAPLTVNNFVVLSRYHFYDGLSCHRIVPGFVAQCGDPEGTGFGGPGYQFADELPTAGEYKIGSLAMANSNPGTNGSQFFIVTGPNGADLPPLYSLFGEVIEGLDTTVPALDAAGNPNNGGVPPNEAVSITSITIEETVPEDSTTEPSATESSATATSATADSATAGSTSE